MLTIKLARIGKKKAPHYRFVVIEKSRDPWARSVEIVGHYNPRSNPSTIELKKDRIEYWLSKGVQCTNTVWNIFVDQGIVKGEKRKSSKITNKRREKLGKAEADKKAAEEEAKKKAEEAAAAEAAADKPAEEAPAETPAEEKTEEAPAEEKPTEEAASKKTDEKPAEEAKEEETKSE